METLREIQSAVHALAVEKGRWGTERSIGESIALVHSELSEALEEAREGKFGIHFAASGKPEGFGVELADAVIRIMDIAEQEGIDMQNAIATKHQYNKTRPHRHGKRF